VLEEMIDCSNIMEIVDIDNRIMFNVFWMWIQRLRGM
jgi:hypothetical protein